MSYSYVFLSDAQHEYEAALDWYLARSIKASENFVISMEDTLDLIYNFPNRWRNEFADYYEISLKK